MGQCVCARTSTSLYKIICTRLCVSIYVARVKLGSLCKPVRRVHGSLEMEVDLEDFHLACFGKGGGTAGQLEWTTGYVCETVALPLMKRERRCRQTGNRSHPERLSTNSLSLFSILSASYCDPGSIIQKEHR